MVVESRRTCIEGAPSDEENYKGVHNVKKHDANEKDDTTVFSLSKFAGGSLGSELDDGVEDRYLPIHGADSRDRPQQFTTSRFIRNERNPLTVLAKPLTAEKEKRKNSVGITPPKAPTSPQEQMVELSITTEDEADSESHTLGVETILRQVEKMMRGTPCKKNKNEPQNAMFCSPLYPESPPEIVDDRIMITQEEEARIKRMDGLVLDMKMQVTSLMQEQRSLAASLRHEGILSTQTQKALTDAKDRVVHLERETSNLKSKLSVTERQAAHYKSRVIDLEKQRKVLHNMVQDLKGNIRVFARLRPLLSIDSSPSSCVSFPLHDPDSRRMVIDTPEDKVDLTTSKPTSWEFEFDKVFTDYASQAVVFEEIDMLVQSVLDGYQVCIFAYGQTGSGKTYTMEGDTTDPEHAGMIPRAVARLFEGMQDMKENDASGKKWQWRTKASNLEIYNETIQDLLSDQNLDKKKHEVRHHKDGSTSVKGLTVEKVSSSKDVNELLMRAKQVRKTSKTLLNHSSSRSHSVFTVDVQGFSPVTNEERIGKLTMVDLAGSERIDKSGATGHTAKEAVSINKSLSSLGDVISALARDDGGHIPFRNSKLTYLLQNTLQGEAKCLMLVNLSPDEASLNESLSSLRFAAKVNSCVTRFN
uniref:Kinesin-like protein n=1 Tax=Attheya septentrionalis TaxID=420275 RepID=A0A7S2UCN0_9STRA|mmetsp:Transcript_1743/g.3107  ORF Transcript_1743/g.3107 Transcript_1743/m.3107 type:complete len:643 (+) Transcript_1743:184-2112(+)